jgi:hypothetical protein
LSQQQRIFASWITAASSSTVGMPVVVSGIHSMTASQHHLLDSHHEVFRFNLAANVSLLNLLLGAAWWRKRFDPAVSDGGLNMLAPVGFGGCM